MKRACVSLLLWAGTAGAQFYLPEGVIGEPTPQHFSVCHAHDCKEIATLALTPEQWSEATAPLGGVTTPEEERHAIGEAIARIERIVGPATGTDRDRGGTFGALGQVGQMDCVDESTNTTTYLTLFARAGLLRHHRVDPRATRGYFLFGWPHTSAVILETASGRRFAVDSWFHDNGHRPEIVPLEQWHDGFEP